MTTTGVLLGTATVLGGGIILALDTMHAPPWLLLLILAWGSCATAIGNVWGRK